MNRQTDPEAEETAAREAPRWSRAHDAESLLSILKHREALLALSRRTPPQPHAAIALSRLLDLKGADDLIVAALERAAPTACGTDAERIELARAQACFEAGRLEEAQTTLERLRDTGADPECAITAALARVRLSLLRGESDARTQLDDAKDRYARYPQKWPWVDSLLLAAEAAVALSEKRKRDAQLLYERALDVALRYDGAIESAVVAGLLGNIELDLGHYEAAERRFAMAIDLSRRVRATSIEAIFGGYRAWALAQLGRPRRARELYAEAIDQCRALGLDRFEAQFEALRSTTALSKRNIAEREIELRTALAALAATGDTERADGLRVLLVLFDVEHARAAHSRDPTGPETQRRLITAYGRLRDARESSDDARLAKQCAHNAFDAALEQLVAPGTPDIVVTPGAAHGRGPTGTFDLENHATLARLLWALIEAWSDDRALSSAELIAVGWPGEKLLADAATHRLQVAVSSLRKRAVGKYLTRSQAGYRLAVATVCLVGRSTLD